MTDEKNNEPNDIPDPPPQVEGPYSAAHITSDISTKEAYFKLLRAWVTQANMSQNAMACFPYYLMANYPHMFQTPSQPNGSIGNVATDQTGAGGGIGAAAGPGDRRNNINRNENNINGNGNGGYFDNDMQQEEIISQNGGYEFVIAPLWKRFVAEMIDVIIHVSLKLLLTFTIVDLFDVKLGIDFDFDALKKSFEDDYMVFFSFSSDFLVFEILTKIAVCFLEALWTMRGQMYVGGATPGKMFMGIRIVYVEAVVPLQPIQPGIHWNNNGAAMRALLYPAGNPGFKRAFCRALAKNILMVLLFPMCFVALFFKNNRTGYDIMAKTIVVEENHAPVLRRR